MKATLSQRFGRDIYQASLRASQVLTRTIGRIWGPDSPLDAPWLTGPRELPVISRPDWTPAGARLALRDADSGMLRSAAQLWQAVRGYGVAHGVISTRTHGLFRLPIEFNGDPEMKVALQGTRTGYAEQPVTDGPEGDFWTMFPEGELAKLTSWGIGLGVGVGRLVPPEEQNPPRPRRFGERWVPVLKTWEAEWLRYQWTTDQWFLTTDKGQVEVTPGRDGWILYRPFGDSHPWLHGAWRSAGLAYILAQTALYDRARHSEVLGSAARVGMAPKGSTERQRAKLHTQIKEMARDNVFVLPEGWELRLVEAVGRTWDIYNDTIKWADREIEISLAGQVVTTEGNSGIGESDIWNDIKGDFIQFTAETVATTLHHQGLCDWTERNYGVGLSPPWARWNITPPKNRKALAEAAAAEADAIAKLGNAISSLNKALTEAGEEQRVDAIQLCARHDVPLKGPASPDPASEEAELTPDAAAALAEKMTAHGVDRCWHGRTNRCPLCGVERVHDFDPGEDGADAWKIQWRPIAKVQATRRLRAAVQKRTVFGIPIRIDRPKGYVQSGTDASGNPWTRVYQVDYGYIPGTEGGDGEALDVFLGPDASDRVFWAVQQKASGDFDELKLFLGFASFAEARACYLAHIPAQYLKSMTPGSLAQVQAMCGAEVTEAL